MKTNVKYMILAALSGCLAFLSFPPAELSGLAWVALVPIMVVAGKTGLRGSFFYSFLSGIFFFGGLLYWLTNVTVPGLVVLVIFLALFWGSFGLAAHFVIKNSKDLLILPFVWVILEYIRGNLFTGFPWGLLAYSQYKNINLIQIADFTGSYGVSFMVAMFNVALLGFVIKRKDKRKYMIVALLFILMASAYGMNSQSAYTYEKGPRISVVQGNIEQDKKWDEAFAEEIIKKHTALSEKAHGDIPDMIIWPETAYPYVIEGESDTPDGVSVLAGKNKDHILAGVVYEDDGGYYNSAVLIGQNGKTSGVYRKTHLVPFGEYVPFGALLARLRGLIDKPIGDFRKGKEYTIFSLPGSTSMSGKEGMIMKQTRFYKFGVMICFEDIFPYLARELVKKRANFLVNITNDAWFGRTAASRQHVQSSVFRAVENRTPVVRAANTGISCFIDSSGNVFSVVSSNGSEIFVEGYSTADIAVCRARAFYTTHGDVFVLFSFIMIIFILVMGMTILRPRTGGRTL